MQKKSLSGDGSCLSGGKCRRGSRKECIRTEQVTDKERSTNVRVADVDLSQLWSNGHQRIHTGYIQVAETMRIEQTARDPDKPHTNA